MATRIRDLVQFSCEARIEWQFPTPSLPSTLPWALNAFALEVQEHGQAERGNYVIGTAKCGPPVRRARRRQVIVPDEVESSMKS